MEKWLETKQMKLTKQTLKRIIKEELDEAITQADPSLSLDQTDPNDGLFQIMDRVQDKAMEYLNITDDELRDKGLDSEFSRMANEIVTSRLQNFVHQMAGELVQKYLMK
tara:strand:+ start:2343 stop:2669 length:327 start_codon:yes stop_codon:yes gene_type:complete